MENKNNLILFIIISFIIGLFFGSCVFSNKSKSQNNSYHMMPDGKMMKNDTSNMSSMMGDMISSLYGKQGVEFDKAFLEEMIVHHEGAILMAQEALKASKNSSVLDMSKAIIKTQTSEIEQMKNWLKDLSN